MPLCVDFPISNFVPGAASHDFFFFVLFCSEEYLSSSQGLPGPPGEKGENGDVGPMVSLALCYFSLLQQFTWFSRKPQ